MCIPHHFASARDAGFVAQQLFQRGARVGIVRPHGLTQCREQRIHTGGAWFNGGQPMPRTHQIGRCSLGLQQRVVLVLEQIQRQLRIEQRIVHLHAPELAVLVVLHEVVVRVARECEWIQAQRVDRG